MYPLEAFDGGLNNKYAPNIIADNQSPDCLNVVYDNLGGVGTRGGMSKLNTAAVGSFAGDGLFTARFNDGTEKMIGWWNGTGYQLGTTTFVTIGSAQSVYTGGSRVDAAMYQNLMFFGNGHSQPYKYNGTEFTRHGITAPNSAGSRSSGTAGASGAATGDVIYKVTYVNSYSVESDVSPAWTTLAVATTASVSLTCIPIAPQSFGVAARRLYRKDSTTGADYKRVATLSDNTTTTFLDEVAPANLGAVAPTDQGEPPVWQYSVTHQERLWWTCAGDSNLYYSELGNPFVNKATNFVPMGDGDGEICRGLAVHANMIVVEKTSHIWLLYMPSTDPTEWVRVKSQSKFGSASHFCQADFPGGRMFLAQRYGKMVGFASIQGADTQQNSTDLAATRVTSDTMSEVIEPDVFQIPVSAAEKACAIEYGNKLWFSVPYGTNQTTNNRVYQFDYTRRSEDKAKGSWVPFEYPVGFSAFTIYSGRLYAQGVSNGHVYLLDTDTFSDDGTAIESYQATKEFFGHNEHMENWKNFRFLNFIADTLGAYYMDVNYKTDADAGVGTTKQVYLASGGSIWGTFVWGVDAWGGGSTRKNVTLSFGSLAGKRIELKFSNQNTLNQGFHVYPNGSFSYNLRGKR